MYHVLLYVKLVDMLWKYLDGEMENSLKRYSSYRPSVCQSVECCTWKYNVDGWKPGCHFRRNRCTLFNLILTRWYYCTVDEHDELPGSVWHQLLEKLLSGDFMLSLSVSCVSVLVFLVYEATFRLSFLFFKIYFSHIHSHTYICTFSGKIFTNKVLSRSSCETLYGQSSILRLILIIKHLLYISLLEWTRDKSPEGGTGPDSTIPVTFLLLTHEMFYNMEHHIKLCGLEHIQLSPLPGPL